MKCLSAPSKRIVVSALLSAIALQSFASPLFADGKRDYYIQEAEKLFYGTTTNAKQAGQAGATNVISTDSSAIVNNPAGIGLNHGGDVSVTYGRNQISGNQESNYAEVEDTSNLGQVLVSVPLQPTLDGSAELGSFGIGWTGERSDSDDSVDTEGVRNQVHGAYGIEVDDNISVGYGLTYVDNKQTTDVSRFKETDGFRHNFGAQMVDGDLTTGANFFFANGEYDLTGPGEFGRTTSTSDYAQHGIEAAVGYRLSDATTVSTAANYTEMDVDGNYVSGPENTFIGGNEGGNFFQYKVGVEQAIDDMLTLRAGYRYIGRQNYFFGREDIRDYNGSAKTNAYSAGASVAIPTGMYYVPTVSLDYAAEYREIAYGDWQHTVTLSFPFTLCEPS